MALSLVAAKCVSALSILVLTVAGFVLPLFLSRVERFAPYLANANSFAAGFLLALGFLHVLQEGVSAWAQAERAQHADDNSHDADDDVDVGGGYPYPFLFAALSVLIIFVVEHGGMALLQARSSTADANERSDGDNDADNENNADNDVAVPCEHHGHSSVHRCVAAPAPAAAASDADAAHEHEAGAPLLHAHASPSADEELAAVVINDDVDDGATGASKEDNVATAHCDYGACANAYPRVVLDAAARVCAASDRQLDAEDEQERLLASSSLVVPLVVGDIAPTATLTVALSLHSFMFGLGLAMQPSVTLVLSTLVAILAHKGIAALVLGVAFSRLHLRLATTLLVGSVFVLSTPLGIGFGLLLELWVRNSVALLRARAVVLSLSAGAFVYVATGMLFSTQQNPTAAGAAPTCQARLRVRAAKKILAVLVGFAVAAGIVAALEKK